MSYASGTPPAESYATPVDVATPLFNPDHIYGWGHDTGRTDSTSLNALSSIVFSTAATPLVGKGVWVFNPNTGTLKFNIGTQSAPVFRSVTNS